MDGPPTIRIEQLERYRFAIDFGAGLPALVSDEAKPIGDGQGPFPEQILTAAVANCLCASLVFALAKYRQEPGGLSAQARCQVDRNAEGRLRIFGIDVEIALGTEQTDRERLDKALAQFERFCTVSESVKTGIPVRVSVRDGDGQRLK